MKETRVSEISAETRAEDTAQVKTLRGLPIVFNQATEIRSEQGSFTEVILPGALDGADLSDSTLIYNHDVSRVPLARTPKTMQLRATSEGLEMVAELADTPTAQEVYTAVLRGDLRGMSFAFTVPEGGSHYDAKTNTRTISKIAKVYEVSVVPFPAYPQTSVEARNAMHTLQSEQRRAAIIKSNKILLKEW